MDFNPEVKFTFDAPFEKAWQDDKGKMFVRAVASDDRMDLQRDRMGPTALRKMAESARKGVPLLETHRSVFEIGKAVGGEILETTEDGKKVRKFVVELELDGEYPQARKLFKDVAAGTCEKQLSIGGKLNLKNKDAVTVEMSSGGLIRTINDLDLDHIATTRKSQAANPRTSFLEAVSKAIDDSGWEPSAEAIRKSSETAVATLDLNTAPDVEADMKAGVSLLATLGKAFRSLFGVKKAAQDSEMTPTAEETPADEETTPETTPEKAIGKGKAFPGAAPPFGSKKKKAPAGSETTPASDETTPEKDKHETTTPMSTPMTPASTQAKAKEEGDMNQASRDMLRDIAVLLAKRGYAGPATTPESDETTPASDETTPEKVLWTVRYLLAKEAEGNLAPGEQAPAAQIIAGGPYAPTDLSAKKPSQMFIPDKATGDANVAPTAVTDHRRNIQVGGEIKNTAPTAKDALDLTMSHVSSTAKLPQVGDADKFGKELTPESIEKTISMSVEKAFAPLLEKMQQGAAEISKAMIESAVTQVMSECGNGIAEVKKSVDGVGTLVNDTNRRLADMEGRVARVEKAGGVSQSGPRGSTDSVVGSKPKPQRGGLWNGLFDKAAGEALSKY